MPALHIRNVDDSVIAALKRRAAARHRSLEGELRDVLEQAAFPRKGKGAVHRKLQLKTVSIGAKSSYSRDEIYAGEER